MENAEKILKTLKDFPKLPTTRISAIVGMNPERGKELLEKLLKEKKIKKIEETLATYWRITDKGLKELEKGEKKGDN